MKKNIALLCGFALFDQFMIVTALWVPYLATLGIGMRQFMELSQLGVRASFCLLGPLVGYGIDAWGLPPVLSALGILFSIAFVFLLLPLVLRDTARAMREASR